MKQGETAKANVTMRKALNLDPTYENERLALSEYPDNDDVFRGYAATFLKAKARADEKSLQMSGAGIAYFHAGDAKRARKALNRSLRLDGKNLGALLYLGVMDLNGGNKNFARKRLERALRTVGGQHNITKLYLARAEMALRQTKRANQRLTSLLEEDSSLVPARYSLGVSYVRTGQKDLGVEQLREVLRADPNFQPAKKVLFDLKE
jgi:Tfp pilus assembly protein PilF